MQRVIITGINGQLGSELRDLFGMENIFETIYLSREELPLENLSSIQPILEKYQPNLIIHAAAYTAVDKAESEKETANIINHLAVAEISQYCKSACCKLISISTDYVFDGNSDVPLTENASLDPINAYGKSKLLGETAILSNLPGAIIIRTSWVYSCYGNNFVKTMIKLMTNRTEISVINDQKGSPTYARDLAKAILDIIKSEKWVPGIFHYSNEGEISWFDFAIAIRDITGLKCEIKPIPTSDYPTAAKRPKYSLLDKSKIKKTYGVRIPFWRDSLEIMLSKQNSI